MLQTQSSINYSQTTIQVQQALSLQHKRDQSLPKLLTVDHNLMSRNFTEINTGTFEITLHYISK